MCTSNVSLTYKKITSFHRARNLPQQAQNYYSAIKFTTLIWYLDLMSLIALKLRERRQLNSQQVLNCRIPMIGGCIEPISDFRK